MNPALEETTALLGRLIAYPTVSADPNRALIADLAERLEALGAVVELFDAPCGTKANLYARLGPDRPGGVMLSGHTDVVPVNEQDWSSDPYEMRRDEGRLYGRGSCDMKGFIAAAMVLAGRVDPARLSRPLWFCFTHDEEVGCLGARALVEQLKGREARPALAIVGEPTEMRVIEGHKGCCEYTTRFSGLEGHGSRPELGVSAVEYAVRYAARLMELRAPLADRAPAGSRFEPPWTTLNIGRLAGGVAHNVIAGKAELEWEMRPVQAADADFVRQTMDRLCREDLLPAMRAVHPEARIETEVIGEVPGLEPLEENAARDLCAALTGANGADLVAFGTEAGLFQSLGVSTVVCGPGSIAQAHKPDEFLALDQLSACLDMLDKLGRQLSA
jgi:acetylornithine deacetylase